MSEAFAQSAVQEPRGLQAFSLHDFLQVDFPHRGFLLSPIIHEQGLTMLYAYRGVGKTLLALAIALAIASGNKLFHWLSALVVHHAGKSGEQRGTSAREDVMDTVVALKHPEDYQPEEGARFEVHIKKSRNVAGEVIAPFEAQLRQDGDAFLWSQSPIHDPQLEEIRALSEQNFSIRAITEKTGIPRTTVHRLLQKAQQLPL